LLVQFSLWNYNIFQLFVALAPFLLLNSFTKAAKILPENILPLLKNRQKIERISLSYDTNDHVYSKPKSVLFGSSYSRVQVNNRINPSNLMSKSV